MTGVGEQGTGLPITLGDIEDAQLLLGRRGTTQVTPVLPCPALTHRLGKPVSFKCENFQRAGSFKIRGALVRIAAMSAAEQARGVVAASAGNHAQGVALAAAALGVQCRIYMPRTVALPKLTATYSHGAEVLLHGQSVDEALAQAEQYARESGAIFVHPFDDPAVVAGQGTVGLEILDQIPDVDTVVTSVGGGGLIAGLAVALKERARQRGRNIKVIGVQAENAASYPPSLAADALLPLESVATIADGIAVGTPGHLPFAIIRELVDEVVTVSEESLARALVFLLEQAKLVVEPAGAVGVAALLDGTLPPGSLGRTVVILSGGNIDPLLLLKVIQRGLSAADRIIRLRMFLADHPGSLATISQIIADADANVTGVDHTRLGGAISVGDVSITLTIETKGTVHCEELLCSLRAGGFDPIVVD